MCCSRSRSARPRWAGAFASLLALALLAACSDPPTRPPSALRPALDIVLPPTSGAIFPVDLGVLPGDVRSEATFVSADGTVYGRSFASYDGGASRFFRWTQAGGMVQVSSIPSAPAYPLPALAGPFPFIYEDAFARAANAKGEATGDLCPGDCDPRVSQDNSHVFRYSAGAGVVELDTRRFGELPEVPLGPASTSHGLSINKWGHVAGQYWPFDGADPLGFFWTPVDSFRLVAFHDLAAAQVNDIDQVVGHVVGSMDECSFVWRPDLGRYDLVNPSGACIGEKLYARALAQQVNGPLVVGWADVTPEGEPSRRHAALWRVPAPNRAAYPRVNANPPGGTSATVRLANGGSYFQLYTATQTSASGPYLEHMDWGDGRSSRRTRSSISATAYQGHVYTKTGTYWVRVYVRDARGRWGVGERRVTVTS